ncbi:MAG: exo-alpha-sialidase [Candidatus Dormibacteraeota bacterium]|uniref:Exo-alpha-sialidase n=1 Tax=Candidatus Amunia macphersoniae TaxID=3127014 RepID=A0A934NE27_9BACT|nr:exo-alpha-sialidase [Candidatus Dormibacteraeota bacterium]
MSLARVPRAGLIVGALSLMAAAGSTAGHAAGQPNPCCNGQPAYTSTNTDGTAGAGGTAVAYHAGGTVITTPSVTAAAPHPLLFRTGYGGWEPSLGVTNDGTIFYATRNSNVDPDPLVSTDSGKTWTAIPPTTPGGVHIHQASLDPYVYVDTATGRVFDTDISPTVTCPPFSHTDDKGAHWSTSVVCGSFDYQKVFGGPPPKAGPAPTGYPNVVYFCAINGGEGTGTSSFNSCSKSLDGGTVFTPTGAPSYPVRAAPASSPQPGATPPLAICDGAAPKGAVGPDGTVYVSRGWCDEPYLAISHDEGATWTRIRVPGKLLPFDSFDGSWSNHAEVAVDANSNIYFLWIADDFHPYLTISRDGGTSWTTPQDILPPGVTRTNLPAIAVGSPGGVAISMMGTTASLTATADQTTWNGYMVISADALDADPTFYAASVNDPATNYFWKDSAGMPCEPVRCGNIGDFLNVEVGPDGTPYAGFTDSCPAVPDKQCTAFTTTTPRGEAILGRLVGGPSLRQNTPPAQVPEGHLVFVPLLLLLFVATRRVMAARRGH